MPSGHSIRLETMQTEWIDIGVNLTHDSFDHDRLEVIRRAASVGVRRMIVTGACQESTEAAIALASSVPRALSATAGYHPHHALRLTADALQHLSRLAHAPEVVAVGECGLDYHRNFSSPHEQRVAFEQQLALAISLQKPLFLHCRDAHRDFMAMLKAAGEQRPRAVLHCFTGTAKELEEALAEDLWIGITGWICDERRGYHLRDLVAQIPVGRLMIETDAPYLLPRDLSPKPQSRRNEPWYLPHIGQVIAKARNEDPESLAAHTCTTAKLFFGLAD
jgi:TatD DNase family protein